MNNRYKRKSIKQIVFKILMIPLLVILAFLAIRAGIAAGDFFYSYDSGIVNTIDTENFKTTMNASLPIINTIYNSGNISVSISGEIKSLIKAVFNFDLDSPLTILNVQSPLFLSYYNNEVREHHAQQEAHKQQPTPVPTQVPEETEPEKSPEPTVVNTPTPAPPPLTPEPASSTTPSPEDGPISSVAFDEEKEDEEKDKTDIVKKDKIEIHNYSTQKINLEQLIKEPLSIKFDKKGPQVLVYHTHTTESYVLNAKDLGKKNVPIYNADPKYNVIRVGDELTKNLEKYGIDVVHNGTYHDNVFNSSYGASLKTMQKYAKSFPSIKIMFDIHRDAAKTGKLRAVTKVNGKDTAQIMFVVGTHTTKLPHPDWKENLKFAIALQQALNDKYPGLARPIWISSNRYNQHITDNTLIIEVGGDGNLLSECLESTKYLAEAVNTVINKSKK